jgi:hypothetical protein
MTFHGITIGVSFRRIISVLNILWLIIVLSLVVFPEKSGVFAQSEKITVYFYSSETNINNFKSLKMEFDSYLLKIGTYEFQPFGVREDFEQQIKDRKTGVILLSSWHYSNIFRQFSLQPVLVGMQNGRHLQKPVLVTSGKTGSMEAAMKGPVASSSNEHYSRTLLKDMFSVISAADIVRILPVPKDVDALMSVSFDMAKAALTTETTLKNLQTVDPMLSKNIKPLAEGREILMLIAAIPKAFAQNSDGIITVLLNMPDDPVGLNILKSLNLDGWKPIDPSDKIKLEE